MQPGLLTQAPAVEHKAVAPPASASYSKESPLFMQAARRVQAHARNPTHVAEGRRAMPSPFLQDRIAQHAPKRTALAARRAATAVTLSNLH